MPRRPTARRATTSSRRTGTPSTSPSPAWSKINVPRQLGDRHRRALSPSRSQATEYFDDVHAAHPARRRATSCPYPRSIPRGVVPTGTTKYEKRGIAVNVPEWHAGQLHPVQPVLLRLPARLHPSLSGHRGRHGRALPRAYVTKPASGKEFTGMQYRMQVSPLDCTGCGNCADVCPAKEQGAGA